LFVCSAGLRLLPCVTYFVVVPFIVAVVHLRLLPLICVAISFICCRCTVTLICWLLFVIAWCCCSIVCSFVLAGLHYMLSCYHSYICYCCCTFSVVVLFVVLLLLPNVCCSFVLRCSPLLRSLRSVTLLLLYALIAVILNYVTVVL